MVAPLGPEYRQEGYPGGVLKKVVWVSTVAVTALAVGGVATVGIVQSGALQKPEVDPGPVVAAPTRNFAVARGGERDVEKLRASLDAAAADPRLGKLHGVIRDESGAVIWERGADQPAKPASSTKILTAAAALLTLPLDDAIRTEIVATEPGTVVIRAAGDVMMTDQQLDKLAEQIGSADRVLIDTSRWSSDTFLPSWGKENIAGGNIAPLEPAMLYAGRIGGTSGDIPRSATPADDLTAALARRVGATPGRGTAPTDAKVVASVTSQPLWQRLEVMMETSDNVLAEAIGREIALKRGTGNDVPASVKATTDVLQEAGFDLSGLTLVDNSGLSETNYNTPRLLDDILQRAVTDQKLRPLLDTLPVASATGTLSNRYEGLPGQGWVRAKTGTLTGVSALAGIVSAADGHTYTFALLSNDSEVLAARAGLDDFVSKLR